jgi:hypothetical protein
MLQFFMESSRGLEENFTRKSLLALGGPHFDAGQEIRSHPLPLRFEARLNRREAPVTVLANNWGKQK